MAVPNPNLQWSTSAVRHRQPDSRVINPDCPPPSTRFSGGQPRPPATLSPILGRSARVRHRSPVGQPRLSAALNPILGRSTPTAPPSTRFSGGQPDLGWVNPGCRRPQPDSRVVNLACRLPPSTRFSGGSTRRPAASTRFSGGSARYPPPSTPILQWSHPQLPPPSNRLSRRSGFTWNVGGSSCSAVAYVSRGTSLARGAHRVAVL